MLHALVLQELFAIQRSFIGDVPHGGPSDLEDVVANALLESFLDQPNHFVDDAEFAQFDFLLAINLTGHRVQQINADPLDETFHHAMHGMEKDVDQTFIVKKLLRIINNNDCF